MTVTKILETTLIAGQTSVTFTDADIPNSLIRIYSNDASLIYTSAILSGTSLTVTYSAQTNNKNIALELVKAGLDIVDDLTSSDADKALSAKQGKSLKDSVDGVASDLSALSDVVNGLNIPEKITDLDDVNVTSISAGQVLAWDADSDKFINVTPSGAGGVDYSETEQDTGIKWIDGKALYQKTVDFGSLPNSTTKTVNHGISNIDNIIDIKALTYYSGQVYGEMMPLVYAGHTFRIIVRSTYIEIQCPNDNWSSYGCYVTIYYTKTA